MVWVETNGTVGTPLLFPLGSLREATSVRVTKRRVDIAANNNEGGKTDRFSCIWAMGWAGNVEVGAPLLFPLGSLREATPVSTLPKDT